MRRMIPLREAARLKGVSEESLRRRILLGEVDATPVDDDRQYLVAVPAAPGPAPCRWSRLLLWSAVAWGVLVLGSLVGSRIFQPACDHGGAIRRAVDPAR